MSFAEFLWSRPFGRRDRGKNEVGYDSYRDLVRSGLDSPMVLKGRSGKVCFGTDAGVGYKKGETNEGVNEDRAVVSTEHNCFASVDGIGGRDNGALAAEILAQELLAAFLENKFNAQAEAQAIQASALRKMKESGMTDGGACYIAAKIDGDLLKIAQAGDVKLIIIGKDGKVRFETSDQALGNLLFNAVKVKQPENMATYEEQRIGMGDRIVIASDGLWKNIEPDEVAELISGKTVSQAMVYVNDIVRERMGSGRPGTAPDNINVIMLDVDRIDKRLSREIN